MPAWHQATQEWVRQGKLAVLAIAEEQHPQRSRLFAHWQKLDWPILHDPINVRRVRGVPVVVAIDEHGIVRSVRPDLKTFKADFLDQTFAPGATRLPSERAKAIRPDPAALRRRAEQDRSAEAWKELGDALVLWHGLDKVDRAIDAYTRALRIQPDDGCAHFRLGVCYRMRYESQRRLPSDFQSAVDHWSKAVAIEPNQYIWRRRVQQYGPRLDKPYPFYDWVETAARQIRARGQQPVELKVLPTASEKAQPSRRFAADDGDDKPPDPRNKVRRDTSGLVVAEVTVVPPRVKPGEPTRVHVTLRPSVQRKAHWNNEAGPLQLWVDTPEGWQVERHLLQSPRAEKPETAEPRHFEFDLRAPGNARGSTELAAYALYYVCEDVGGSCRFLRQDIHIAVQVDE